MVTSATYRHGAKTIKQGKLTWREDHLLPLLATSSHVNSIVWRSVAPRYISPLKKSSRTEMSAKQNVFISIKTTKLYQIRQTIKKLCTKCSRFSSALECITSAL